MFIYKDYIFTLLINNNFLSHSRRTMKNEFTQMETLSISKWAVATIRIYQSTPTKTISLQPGLSTPSSRWDVSCIMSPTPTSLQENNSEIKEKQNKRICKELKFTSDFEKLSSPRQEITRNLQLPPKHPSIAVNRRIIRVILVFPLTILMI